jgi:hypothetical protein
MSKDEQLEPRYEKLSQSQKGEVPNDLNQHLNLSQAQHESPNSFIAPVTRAEWEQELESSVEMGIAKPGETYEEYLASLRKRGFIVCSLHND